MSKINIKHFIIFFTTFVTSCDLMDDRLTIINDSDSEVNYIISTYCPDSILEMDTIPLLDFNYDESSEEYSHSFCGTLKSFGRKRISYMSSWKNFVLTNCNKQLVIFTIKTELVEEIIEDSINTNEFIYERNVFSLAELEDSGWKAHLR